MHLLFSTPPRSGIRPAIFFDRDGVINERIVGGYVTEWAQFRFLPGIRESLARLAALGVPIIVVSNQAGVGKGLCSVGSLERITERFVAELASAGARIDAVYYCPHAPAENCDCRKPRCGLLRQAGREWRIDMGRSVLVGDSWTDVQAARSAGCKAVLLASGDGQTGAADGVITVGKAAEIADSARQLLGSRVDE